MALTWRLVVVDVDSIQLLIVVSMVRPRRVDAVFVTYHLPELEEK